MPSRPYSATGGFESGAAGAAYERICELAMTLGTATRWGAAAREARRIARLENMMEVIN